MIVWKRPVLDAKIREKIATLFSLSEWEHYWQKNPYNTGLIIGALMAIGFTILMFINPLDL